MNDFSQFAFIGAAVFTSLIYAQQSCAMTLVDFEAGFTDGDRIGVVDTGDNQVTFQIGLNGTPSRDVFLATPRGTQAAFLAFNTASTAYLPPNVLRNQADQDRAGNFFLTDGDATASDYFISFEQAVSFVSLDLLDFDGASARGGPGQYTISIFSDKFTTVLDSLFFGDSPDGIIDTVSFDGFDNIYSLLVAYATPNGGGDPGTALDNLTFETVPTEVPTPTAILPTLFGMGMASFRKRFSKNETSEDN